MTTFTIDLRKTDKSVLTTLKLSKDSMTWHDVHNEGSPLIETQGKIIYPEGGGGQFHCNGSNSEIVRLVNIDWLAVVGRNGKAFCYGCKTGFDKEPQWYLTNIS
jgi:hypothetical protein